LTLVIGNHYYMGFMPPWDTVVQLLWHYRAVRVWQYDSRFYVLLEIRPGIACISKCLRQTLNVWTVVNTQFIVLSPIYGTIEFSAGTFKVHYEHSTQMCFSQMVSGTLRFSNHMKVIRVEDSNKCSNTMRRY